MSEQERVHICPICTEPVVDDGEDGCAQDALFCEGVCKCWHHRWCASVTKERYSFLSDSEEPFLCPSCTSSNQQAAIASLQNCLKALTDEVRSLKATVASIQTQVQSAPTVTGRADTGETTATRNPAHHGRARKRATVSPGRLSLRKRKAHTVKTPTRTPTRQGLST